MSCRSLQLCLCASAAALKGTLFKWIRRWLQEWQALCLVLKQQVLRLESAVSLSRWQRQTSLLNTSEHTPASGCPCVQVQLHGTGKAEQARSLV